MTSIKWLEKELLKNGYMNKGYYNQDSLNHLENILEQAKEMHKQEIIDAYGHGQNNGYMYSHNKAINISKEHYYEETFKKD